MTPMDDELRRYYEKRFNAILGEDVQILGKSGEPAKATLKQKIAWRFAEARCRIRDAIRILRHGDDGREGW